MAQRTTLKLQLYVDWQTAWRQIAPLAEKDGFHLIHLKPGQIAVIQEPGTALHQPVASRPKAVLLDS